jgi:hypothetical protein
MIKINNENELKELLEKTDWHDSFIREAYIQSPSYISDDLYMIAPDEKWSMKIIVILRDQSFSAIEFLLEGIERISLTSNVDVNPVGKIDNNQVFLHMNKYSSPIVAQKIYYSFLDKNANGYNNYYCYDNLFGEDGLPMSNE